MFAFVVGIILFIIAVIGLIVALGSGFEIRAARKDGRRVDTDAKTAHTTGWVVAVVFLFFAALALFFSSFTTVPTRSVAVVTAFGRPDGEIGNGAHFIAPWESTHIMNAAVQTETFTDGPDSQDQNHRCQDVRLGNQSIGCAEVRFYWQIQPHDATTLYATYRSQDHLRSTLVLGSLKKALNNAFADYNPITLLTTNTAYTDVLNAKSTEVQDLMQQYVGDQVKITSVIVPLVNYNSQTQATIDAFQTQVGKTRVAQQAVITAQQQALANKIIADSLKNNDSQAVLISKCLDLVAEKLPVPGTCLPFAGTGSSVIVGGH